MKTFKQQLIKVLHDHGYKEPMPITAIINLIIQTLPEERHPTHGDATGWDDYRKELLERLGK